MDDDDGIIGGMK